MKVYNWEREVQGWFLGDPWLPVFKWMNIILAGEEVMTLALPWLTLAMILTTDHWVVLFVGAFLSVRHVEAWIKERVKRGRPDCPAEWGFPSGDCMVVTTWALPLLGIWGLVPILLVAWARIAQERHWPLDVLAGIGLGMFLTLPLFVASWWDLVRVLG